VPDETLEASRLEPPADESTLTAAPGLIQAQLTARPGDRFGRYKILEEIGQGGCGVVFVAEQEEPVRRRVALKVIKLGMDTRQVIARFEAERQALAMMDHPNIAKVLDAGATDTGRPFFVMELVRGIKITDYCDQHKLTTTDRLKLFIQVCQAIQHAHQKGIIHRDLKPSNILVTLHDGMPVPKVIDFGIAKATADQKLTDKTVYTAFEQFIGTPAYMSPEQAEMAGLDIDTRSDIYSLGVLLYELLVGETPFSSEELLGVGLDAMRRVLREKDPARPSTKLSTMTDADLTAIAQRRQSEPPKLIGSVRGDLDWIVMKCLEKDRTRRYETANGLAMDVLRHLQNEPVIARPPSAAYRLQKAVSRNKLAFGAATAVAAALLAGVAISSWQKLQARRAQRETEAARNSEQKQRLEAQSALTVAQSERKRADAQAQKAFENQLESRRLLYDADMNLAQQAVQHNNLGRARRLLDRHRPQPGEQDLRGWEWRYLWQLTRSSALATLTNCQSVGASVSFSPDGTRLAVGWKHGRAELWDVPGRRLLRSLPDNSERVAFSPVRNLLAVTSGANAVTLYDLDSDQTSTLWRAPQPIEDLIDVAFSQDGSRVLIYTLREFEDNQGFHSFDEVWVVNVSSTNIESRYATPGTSFSAYLGAAQLSPDNHRLYVANNDLTNSLYSIQCIDLATGKEIWQTERETDLGLTTLAISPDGLLLASGSGYEDPTIRVWDAATGRLLSRLEGHTAWVCKLVFTKDGRRLLSAASDESIRFWDTRTWTETKVLRGHKREIPAVAISDTAHVLASVGKDGDLMLWKDEPEIATDGYSRLSQGWKLQEVRAIDHSCFVLQPYGEPPAIVDFKRDAIPRPLPEIGPATNILGWFGTNILCLWNGTNQILVRELRAPEFISLGAVALDSGARPAGLAFNARHQLLAWAEGHSTSLVSVAHLATPGRRNELRSDVDGLVPWDFSEDGTHLSAMTENRNCLRVWNIDTGEIVVSVNADVRWATFAAGGTVFVVTVGQDGGHEVRFYDLVHPERAPQRFPGKGYSMELAVSPDGALVASPTHEGEVRLFDAAKGELLESIRGHLHGVFSVAFSPDGRRLISASGGREAIKVWDVGTRQELLTLRGVGSVIRRGGWSADGDVIFVGWPGPWQAWRAPSWEEITAAEARDRTEVQRP
jgi:serine/threonine protein kinase/WD40 repeat protein